MSLLQTQPSLSREPHFRNGGGFPASNVPSGRKRQHDEGDSANDVDDMDGFYDNLVDHTTYAHGGYGGDSTAGENGNDSGGGSGLVTTSATSSPYFRRRLEEADLHPRESERHRRRSGFRPPAAEGATAVPSPTHSPTHSANPSIGAANEDVTLHQRKRAWAEMYGRDTLQTVCCLCQLNPVGLQNVGFDMAHVVARCRGGNNTALWNRVPTCRTCNGNVANGTNLLDFVADVYPRRLWTLVQYLHRQFCADRPLEAALFESYDDPVPFVRAVFGTEPCASTDDTPPGHSSESGRVRTEKVYDLLRHCVALRERARSSAADEKQWRADAERLRTTAVHLDALAEQALERRQETLQQWHRFTGDEILM